MKDIRDESQGKIIEKPPLTILYSQEKTRDP
jgi:hypothetical protein